MTTLNFKYYGGEEKVFVSTTSSTGIPKVLPIGDCTWLTCKPTISYLHITVQPNASYEDRACKIKIPAGYNKYDYVEVKQEGYRNMLVDLAPYVIVPYTFYLNYDYFELPIRVYGGSGTFIADAEAAENTVQVYDSSDFYNDYIMYIPKGTDATYIFEHADRTAYIQYCKDNGLEYDESKLVKEVVVKYLDESSIEGFVTFGYNGEDYINNLPPKIVINNSDTEEIEIKFGYYVDSNFNVVENSKYNVSVDVPWVTLYYDDDEKKIYLTAASENLLGERSCLLTVVNRFNPKQSYSTVITQYTQPAPEMIESGISVWAINEDFVVS